MKSKLRFYKVYKLEDYNLYLDPLLTYAEAMKEEQRILDEENGGVYSGNRLWRKGFVWRRCVARYFMPDALEEPPFKIPTLEEGKYQLKITEKEERYGWAFLNELEERFGFYPWFYQSNERRLYWEGKERREKKLKRRALKRATER